VPVVSSVPTAWYFKNMDVTEIAERTGIAVRQLRYAIYHMLIPGVSRVETGKGTVRRFTDFEAFGIALVAMLLEAGLRRELVSDCMDLLVRSYGRKVAMRDTPLWRAFLSRGTALVEIADRRFARVRLGGASGEIPFDSGWKTATGEPPRNGYAPAIALSVNLTSLRDALRKRG
jgi:hypothetical protein